MDVMDDLFAPPGHAWQRLSPAYRNLRRLTTALVAPLVLSVPALVLGLVWGLWWISLALWGVAAVIVALRWSLIERTWRSWGYVEREDDLYITHGVVFRSLVAVPYGRMQLVEVASGPLERAFGLATVSLKTASPETNATIPGLPPEEAARLRDRLTELGEAHASGL
ncbi:PH domain-containing protein [Microlunatus capsulatus]